MGLFDWVSRGEIRKPRSTYQAAYGSVYASDILRNAGIDPKKLTEEQRQAIVALFRAKMEEAAKKHGGKKILGLVSIDQMQRQSILAPFLGPAAALTVAGKVGEDKKHVDTRYIIDDLTSTRAGIRGRELRAIAAGEIEGPPESPLPVRAANQLVSNLISMPAGRVEISGVEQDPTKERSWAENAVLGASGLIGAGIPIAVMTRLGISAPVAVGMYEASRPELSPTEIPGAFGRGMAIGAGGELFSALRLGFLRKLFRGNSETMAKFTRYVVEGGVGRHMSAGELGAVFAAGEKLAHGEMPTLDDLLIGYASFAIAHAPVEFAHSMKPSSRAFRAAERDIKKWEKSDDPNAVLARKAREAGDFATYSRYVKGKLLDLLRYHGARVRGKETSRYPLEKQEKLVEDYFRGLEEWERETREKGLEELEQRNRAQEREKPTKEEEAYREQRKPAEEEVAFRERAAQQDRELLKEQPSRQLSRREAIDLIVQETGISRTAARRVLGNVRRQVAEKGRRYYDEGEVLTRAQQEANRLAWEAKKRNLVDPTLRPHKDAKSARRTAKKLERESGGDAYDVYEDVDGKWYVRRRRPAVDATEPAPELRERIGKEPPRPSRDIDKRLKVAEEAAALKRIGASGREWAEKQRQIEAERRERGRRLREKAAQAASERKAGKQPKNVLRGRPLQEIIDRIGELDPIAKRQREIEAEIEADAERARQEALASGAMTPEQARELRMREAQARREDIAARQKALTPEQVVEIANREGGMDWLKERGYEQIDVLRAVHEAKTGQKPGRLPAGEKLGGPPAGARETIPPRDEIIKKLEEKQFYGTIDRLKRGQIDDATAWGEYLGQVSPKVEGASRMDPASFAEKMVRSGVGRKESWSRWIQYTSLNPGMDAKDWYKIYDRVASSGGGDVYIGSLFGGASPEQWMQVMGWMRGGVKFGAHTGLRVVGGVVEGINRALRPVDMLYDRALGRIYKSNFYKSYRERIEAIGNAIAEKTGVSKRFGIDFTDLMHMLPMDDLAVKAPEVADFLRHEFVAPKHWAEFVSQERARKLRGLIDEARKDMNRFRRERGLRPLREGEFDLILDLVYQYGAPAPDGSRPGIKQMEREIKEAEALGVDLKRHQKLLDAADDASNIIRNYDEMPDSFRKVIEAHQSYFEKDFEHGQKIGLLGKEYIIPEAYVTKNGKARERVSFKTYDKAQKWADRYAKMKPHRNPRVKKIGNKYYVVGDVGALPPGMRYVPMGFSASIRAGDVEHFGKRRYTDPTKPTALHARYHDSGILDLILSRGRTLRSYDLSNLYAKSHVDVALAELARKMVNGLLMRTIVDENGVEMPAAITETNLRLKMAHKIAEREGIDVKDVPLEAAEAEAERFMETHNYGDYTVVSGFNWYSDGGYMEHVYLHPDVARPLAHMREAPVHSFVTKLGGIMKAAQLTMSPFHYWALAINTLSMGANPFEAWRNWEKLNNSKLMKKAIDHGLVVTNDVFLGGPDWQQVFELGYGAGIVKETLSKAERWFNKKLWIEMYRATKLVSWDVQRRRFMEQDFSEKEAGVMAAELVNELHGGWNLDWHGVSRRIKQYLGIVMLAPDWTISNSVFSLRAAFGNGPISGAARATLLRYLAMHFFFGNFLNYLLSGHSMLENEEGHKWEIESGADGPVWDFLHKIGLGKLADEWSRHKYHIDIAGHMLEIFRPLAYIIDKLIPGEQFTGFKKSPGKWISGKASPIVKTTVEFTKGQTYYGSYGLAGTEDMFKRHRTIGKYGEANRSLDALGFMALRNFIPISLMSTMESMVRRGDRFYVDPMFLSGVSGRHFTEQRRRGIKLGSGGGRSRRPRSARRRGRRPRR